MTVNIGPLSVQTAHLLFLSALLVAVLVGNWAGRKKGIKTGSTLIDMTFYGLLAARIVFVLSWFELYLRAPLTILDIRDGGFNLWAGLAAAMVVALWKAKKSPQLREPLAAGLLAGAMAWFISGAPTLLRMGEEKTIPAVMLTTVRGAPAGLAPLAQGKPMVVNLWASWCPPCRHEMPVLAQAQGENPGIVFAFVNQGQTADAVSIYLNKERVHLANVLLDPGKALGLAVGSAALPTTLFYDGSGKLVDLHLGALSAASLQAKLTKLAPARSTASATASSPAS